MANNTFAEKLEIGLRLDREEIRGVYNQFVLGFWGLSEHELFEPNRIRGISNTRPLDLNQIDKLILSDITFTAGQYTGLKERIIELIDNTEGPIYLASFSFDKDHVILMKIKEEAKTRDILIFARPRSPAMKSLIDLASHTNITVYGHPDFHAKGILSFNKKEPSAIMMTANFESLGLDSGFETGVFLRREKAQEMFKIFIDWQNTFPHLLKPQLIRGEYEGEILNWNQYQFQRKSIELTKQVDLGTFRVNNFVELDKFRPNLPQQDTERILHQKLIYHWKNLPPLLPSKSKFLEKKENLEIYTKDDSKYIVVSKPKEYDKALKLIKEENAMIVVKE